VQDARRILQRGLCRRSDCLLSHLPDELLRRGCGLPGTRVLHSLRLPGKLRRGRQELAQLASGIGHVRRLEERCYWHGAMGRGTSPIYLELGLFYETGSRTMRVWLPARNGLRLPSAG
jgi:hypothetical protein